MIAPKSSLVSLSIYFYDLLLILCPLLLDVKPNNVAPYFPGTLTIDDVESACDATPFPTLSQNPAVTSVAPVYVFLDF